MKAKFFRVTRAISCVFVFFLSSTPSSSDAAAHPRANLENSTARANRPASETLTRGRIRREISSELQHLVRESASSADTPSPASTETPIDHTSTAASKEPAKAQSKEALRTVATTAPDKRSASHKKPAPTESAQDQKQETSPTAPQFSPDAPKLTTLRPFQNSKMQLSHASETPLIFDIPVTYNERVRSWIRYFQTTGHSSFRRWLERSSRYMPLLQYELTKAGLPQDLVYVAMIESGFNSHAESHAGAMGMWQFIAPTGKRYGLKIDWWIDERRDFHKATSAAIRYMTDLNRQFGSWYLVAASYNMGENGVRRLIARHKTNNFWELAEKEALPKETRDYVPKIIAAVLISKAPALYGFRDLEYQMPLSYEYSNVPGGTELAGLADHLGVSEKYLKDLNPELLKGYVPKGIRAHKIRVPKGSVMTVSGFVGNIDPALN